MHSSLETRPAFSEGADRRLRPIDALSDASLLSPIICYSSLSAFQGARCGEMAERLMAPVLKTGIPERVSGVRIPLTPPSLTPVPGCRRASHERHSPSQHLIENGGVVKETVWVGWALAEIQANAYDTPPADAAADSLFKSTSATPIIVGQAAEFIVS